MAKSIEEGGSFVLRALMSSVTFWALVGIAVIFVGDAAIRGRFAIALRAALILGLLVWCAWVLLYRMSIRVDADGLTVRNLLRWVRIPWGQVAEISRRMQLRVVLADNSVVECWGGTFASRPGTRRSREADRGDPGLALLRTAHAGARKAGGTVQRGWDVPALAAGTVLLIAAALAALL
ncbi:hypothetical protein GCM10022240_12580 [Microbacterium kribbense]|uniref:Low molecular weight protein antigen 6 PH domain-containing protein n=1 Tax=Microbacterium kribbense TaxID=433645 RepID=A0ABP7GIK1_9MICO